MRWRNTARRYGGVTVWLHWIIVAGIIAQYFLAEAGEEHEGATAGAIDPMNLHSSLGITLLALALLRLVWRLIEQPPVRAVTAKPYEVLLMRSVHAAFYVLLFAIPLSGWILTSVEGEAFRFFGTFPFPALPTGASGASKEFLEEVHEVLFNILVALAVLHVAAALKHRFIDHTNSPGGMLPGHE